MRILALLSLTSLVVACGSKDDSATGTGTGTDATGTGTGAATGSGTGAAATGTGTGATATGTGTGASTTPCTTWVATYDLTGSTLFIDATADFLITVQEPYDEDLNTGPGSLTLRFTDAGGAAGEGAVVMEGYDMHHGFVTGIPGLATVTTDIQNDAINPCGVAMGTLAGTTVTWAPNEIGDYCRNGSISCTGSFCGTSGTPPEGQPEVYKDECSTLPITTFEFSADLLSFTMEETVITGKGDVQTTHTLIGTATAITEDAATPECMCGG